MAPAAAPLRPSVTVALAAAWLLAVAAVAAAQRHGVGPSAAALASSPERLAHGAVWTLASSALVIDGPHVGQIAMTTIATAWVLATLGGRAFWRVAIAGHVGATLLAYTGIAVLWLVMPSRSMEQVTDAPDFGISAVWAALLGAIAVAGVRLGRSRRRRLTGAAGLAVLAAFALLVPLDGELSDVEHLLAFLAGALVTVRMTDKRNTPLIMRQGTEPTVGREEAPPHPRHEASHPSRAS